MKKITIYHLLIVLMVLSTSSCEFNGLGGSFGVPGAGYNPPPDPVVPLDQIEGTYEGSITYWEKGTSLSYLSKESGYITSIAGTDNPFTLSFDSSFIYTIPNLQIQCWSPYSNKFHIVSGQEYDNGYTIHNPDYAGTFNIKVLNGDSTLTYHISMKSTLQDSIYSLTVSGRRSLN